MIYLVEFDAVDAAGNLVTERLATDGYTTRASDTPSSVYFAERIINPGNFERSMFGIGRTSGEAEVGYGVIECAIGDDGSGETLDRLAGHAVDGRRLRIYGLDSVRSPWAQRVLVFDGTMEQIEISWTVATIRIRDRLAELRKEIQSVTYAGTTVAGGMNEAEGAADDLKDRPKPLLFGIARNIPAVLANRFDRIYQVSSKPLSAILGVYDRGVPLTAGADHATIAALRTATIPGGQYHTALALGLIRVAAAPDGDLTVDASEGNAGDRSAAGIVRRMLDAAGVAYASQDIVALQATAPAEVGLWLPPETRDLLASITSVLDSVGAYMVPDAQGLMRFGRLDAALVGGIVIDRTVILDAGEGIERLVTNDDGRGVPAWKVSVSYARSWMVQNGTALDNTAVTDARKAFVGQEYRQAVSESEAVKDRHLLASELTFTTLIDSEADAVAEAARRMTVYGVRRERYRVPLKTEIAVQMGIDIGDAVTLRLDRFGLSDGKPMIVIAVENELETGITTLDLWG